MKKLMVIIGLMICSIPNQVVLGQLSEGIITYEVKVNVHKTLPPENEEMKNMIPEFRTSKEILRFKQHQSLYKPVPVDDEDEDFENDGMRIRFRAPQNEIYIDQSSGIRTSLQDFMGKKFIIHDTVKIIPWKFENGSKEIAGYQCKKAVYFDEERKETIVAWYTEKIRPSLGPEIYHTLPGTVLQIDINEGTRVITALSVQSKLIDQKDLMLPSRGTKISRSDFRKMIDEHRERMRANGANVIIRN